MSDIDVEKRIAVEQEFEFEEPPQKVWQAISVPEIRDGWLPADALDGPDGTTVEPGRSVSYRMREPTAPFLESTVTFEILSNGFGGTRLRIRHELTDARTGRTRRAANGNGALMLAA